MLLGVQRGARLALDKFSSILVAAPKGAQELSRIKEEEEAKKEGPPQMNSPVLDGHPFEVPSDEKTLGANAGF